MGRSHCEACALYRRGGKSRVAIPHTCGEEEIKKPLTDALKDCLKECPKGKWFEASDMWKIRRASYMLHRLADLGFLESKVFDTPAYTTFPKFGTIHTFKFRVIKQAEA
jgi:hypothetical protein